MFTVKWSRSEPSSAIYWWSIDISVISATLPRVFDSSFSVSLSDSWLDMTSELKFCLFAFQRKQTVSNNIIGNTADLNVKNPSIPATIHGVARWSHWKSSLGSHFILVCYLDCHIVSLIFLRVFICENMPSNFANGFPRNLNRFLNKWRTRFQCLVNIDPNNMVSLDSSFHTGFSW